MAAASAAVRGGTGKTKAAPRRGRRIVVQTLALLIAIATGIDRQWDTDLAKLALQRANEVAVTFDHRAMPELNAYSGGEVLATNRYAANPYQYAVNGWLDSPPHAAVLTNLTYTHVGCAERVVAEWHYFVCLFTNRAYSAIGGPTDIYAYGWTVNVRELWRIPALLLLVNLAIVVVLSSALATKS